MSVDVSQDAHGYVCLRHARWADTEPTREVFTMTREDWEDLRRRAARDELERRRNLPFTLPLADVLGDRLMLGRTLNCPQDSR